MTLCEGTSVAPFLDVPVHWRCTPAHNGRSAIDQDVHTEMIALRPFHVTAPSLNEIV
jgi:hypothetical protein